MGWRFRRSKSLGPVRLTLSKGGVGVSIGGRGARIGLGADGKSRATLSIPGTGIAYQTTAGGARRSPSRVVLLLLVIAALVAAGAALLVFGAVIMGCEMAPVGGGTVSPTSEVLCCTRSSGS